MSNFKPKNKYKPLPKKSFVSPSQKDLNTFETELNPDLIYGCYPVLAALENKQQLNRLYLNAKILHDRRFEALIAEAKANGTVIDVVDNKRLDQLTNRANHQGIVAKIAPYDYIELEDLISQAKSETENPVIIIADGINDPHNLGAIIRTAEAFSMQGLIIPQRRAVGVTSTVMKVAAGALAYFPVARVVNLNQAIASLQAAGFWIYGTIMEGKSLHQTKFEGAIGLVIGSEEKGISPSTAKACDFLISIPMTGKTPSLNASVASAICLYEIRRQLTMNN